MDHAACRGLTYLFFPTTADGTKGSEVESRIALPRSICESCPVQAECLDYALRWREPHGVWGGKSSRERWSWSSSAPDQSTGSP
jgi:WhiB family redox-sensing transcriptional regulator